jgi:endogenous inhibitor of DNA gyrase (YacG/DUF329 family)
MLKQVRCPHCRRETPWAGNPYRPFCSERCRLLDLHDWATERHRIPGPPAEESAEGAEDGEDEPG